MQCNERNILLRRMAATAALSLGLLLATAPAATATEFVVELPANAPTESGRLFVFLTTDSKAEPRLGPNWFHPEPFFGIDVAQFVAGQPQHVDLQADGFPDRLDKLPSARYRVQAVWHTSLDRPDPGRAPGNRYSPVVDATFGGGNAAQITLRLDQVVSAEPLPERDWIKWIELTSPLLSKFHGRPIVQRAGVVLPASYTRKPDQRYPVVYSIPGFGGSLRDALRYQSAAPEAEEGEAEFIRVFLDPRCRWGHHVFADSATNGPRGQALIDELIPAIDQQFRTIPAPMARFVTGHSSGGWTSLWLQVTYPDTFGGVWSTAPDPVDFRDFQQIDLYADPPQNMYRDASGARRPIARRGNMPMLWYDSFCKMDDVLKRGGQLRSFEAVFSPAGPGGEPAYAWDRQTGTVNTQVTRAWERYDIGLTLERHWASLEPRLRGKLHVYMGAEDTFYLEGATIRLAETLRRLKSDAVVEIFPGRDHSNLVTREFYTRIRREMTESFRKNLPSD